MENRHTIHYHRNTVNPPKIRKDERARRLNIQGHEYPHIEVEYQPKVFAVYECLYCEFKDDRPFVICPMCRNCQHCGLYNQDRYANRCVLCGNHMDLPRLDTLKKTVSDR